MCLIPDVVTGRIDILGVLVPEYDAVDVDTESEDEGEIELMESEE